jgi:hypothetical protein
MLIFKGKVKDMKTFFRRLESIELAVDEGALLNKGFSHDNLMAVKQLCSDATMDFCIKAHTDAINEMLGLLRGVNK